MSIKLQNWSEMAVFLALECQIWTFFDNSLKITFMLKIIILKKKKNPSLKNCKNCQIWLFCTGGRSNFNPFLQITSVYAQKHHFRKLKKLPFLGPGGPNFAKIWKRFRNSLIIPQRACIPNFRKFGSSAGNPIQKKSSFKW